MYRNSFVLWFCMSQSYPVEFLQTWNQQICLKPLQTKRRPAAIDGLEVLQGDDCTWNQWSWYGTGALLDETTGSVTWSCEDVEKKGLGAQMEWKIGTWKCFETKKDRIGSKQTLMEVFCKLIVILFVAQDFLQGFPDVSQRLTEEWICNIDVIMFQRDCCKFGQTRLLELCISSMLHWCYVNKLVVCYVLCGFRM